MDRANGFTIVPACEGAAYEGLRALWCEVFGDEPAYVDALYKNFESSVRGYAVTDTEGNICSALTCYICGSFDGRPVYVSYAVCTRKDMRGRGLAGRLTAYARDEAVSAGGISIVSPAEPGLEGFYASLGYEPLFYVDEKIADAGSDEEDLIDFDDYDLDIGGEDTGEAFIPGTDLQAISAPEYSRLREQYLSGRPHIVLDADMMRFIESDTADGRGLFSVNRGDAVCAVSEAGNGTTVIAELLINPVLKEISLDIDEEIAIMTARHFGDERAVYRTTGTGSCQSMAFGPDISQYKEETGKTSEAYFGFPLD